MTLTAAELLAGADLEFQVTVPAAVLAPAGGAPLPDVGTVTLRPLRVADLEVIGRAAQEGPQLYGTLMVQRALVAPELTIPQVAALHAGLVHFLLGEVNRISGLDGAAEVVAEALEAPLTQAAYVLARAYGWTPAEVNALTLGQVLLHLELLHRDQR